MRARSRRFRSRSPSLRPGHVTVAKLGGFDDIAPFANCVERTLKQVNLAPFRGAAVVLRTTLALPGEPAR
jgi:hypothetical protein